MRSLFENMLTTIIVYIMIFSFISIGMVGVQILNARKIHTSVINQIQSSYYGVDINTINAKLSTKHPNWYFELEELTSTNARRDYNVRLQYEVIVPVFNIVKEAKIEGYAR